MSGGHLPSSRTRGVSPRKSGKVGPACRRAGGFGLALAIPVLLLFDLTANFYYDWHNHQWLVGYFGEYFRRHWAMPETLSVAGAIGMPQPVFYGFLLYPCLGLISAV